MIRALLIAITCAVIAASTAWGACPSDISYSTSGSGTPGSFSCSPAPGGSGLYDIDIVATSTGTLTYTIEIDNGLSIRRIEVKNDGSSSTAVQVTVTTAGRVENVRRHASTTGEVWIGTLDAAAGIGTGSGGLISVDRIESLITAGDITAEIDVAGSAISGENTAINSITCSGDLKNDVTAAVDNIGTITVAGDILHVDDPTQVQILAYDSIGSVEADSIVASIKAGYGNATTAESIGVIRTLSSDYSGEIQTDDLLTGIFVARDLVAGGIHVTNALTAPIWIGRDFGKAGGNSGIIIDEASGLEAQIILNQADVGGEWTSGSTIVIDSATLTGPTYSALPSTLGGGAVGEAEFRLHRKACVPEYDPLNGPAILYGELDMVGWEILCVEPNANVALEYYGPVALSASSEDDTHQIEYCSGSTWVDVYDDFTVSRDSGNHRKVIVDPDTTWDFGSYRITRSSGGLLCEDVDGTPEVATFTYYLDVVYCEEFLLGGFDMNADDNLTDAGDLPAWTLSPSDLNGDAAADADDLLLLDNAIDEYEAGAGVTYYPGPWN